MAEPFTTSRLREAAARIASRRKTADQRLRILERLTMGLSVAHRARAEQLTARRAPQIIAEMLARRETRSARRLRAIRDRAAEQSDDRPARVDERTRLLSPLLAGPNSLGEGCGGAAAPREADGKTDSPGNGAATP